MRQARELEICVETLQACHAADLGGADRMELCAALGEGGVSPSRGFIREAVTASTRPIHVLVRPRSGHFVYTEEEFRVMCADVDDALGLGAAGVVLGLLTPVGEVDRSRMAELVRLAHGRLVTFHRAFDHTRDLFEALEILVDVGCSRVLTSGGKPTVMEGIDALSSLAQRAGGRIRVAAGGGVNLRNALQLTRVAGLDLHASLRARASASQASDPLWQATGSDLSAEAVRALRAVVHEGDAP